MTTRDAVRAMTNDELRNYATNYEAGRVSRFGKPSRCPATSFVIRTSRLRRRWGPKIEAMYGLRHEVIMYAAAAAQGARTVKTFNRNIFNMVKGELAARNLAAPVEGVTRHAGGGNWLTGALMLVKRPSVVALGVLFVPLVLLEKVLR